VSIICGGSLVLNRFAENAGTWMLGCGDADPDLVYVSRLEQRREERSPIKVRSGAKAR
jgi:hypothetical protein